MQLVQLETRPQPPKPSWLRVKLPTGKTYSEVKRLVRQHRLHTVCEEAMCPNIGECWEQRSATLMLLGDTCTRSCGFCAVRTGRPGVVDEQEPERVVETIATLGLRYAVVTSVNRDDLPDGGSRIFAAVIRGVRQHVPGCRIEVLIPDFKGNWEALAEVVEAGPDVLNHNMESIARLYDTVRPQAKYERSLELLRRVKDIDAAMRAKSGLMVGLGEEPEEIVATMRDLRDAHCDLLTIGQYLRRPCSTCRCNGSIIPTSLPSSNAKARRWALRTSSRVRWYAVLTMPRISKRRLISGQWLVVSGQ